MAINIKNEPFNVWCGRPGYNDDGCDDNSFQPLADKGVDVLVIGSNTTLSYGFYVCLSSPRPVYKVKLLPFPECVTIEGEVVHYTILICGQNGMTMPLAIRVNDGAFYQPGIDIDKLFRQTFKRRSEDSIDTLRSHQ